MKKKKDDTMELELEEYIEPYDVNFYSLDSDEEDIIEVEDESSYDDFNTVQEIDWSQEEEEMEEEEEDNDSSYSPKKKSTGDDSIFYRVFPTASSLFGIIGAV